MWSFRGFLWVFIDIMNAMPYTTSIICWQLCEL